MSPKSFTVICLGMAACQAHRTPLPSTRDLSVTRPCSEAIALKEGHVLQLLPNPNLDEVGLEHRPRALELISAIDSNGRLLYTDSLSNTGSANGPCQLSLMHFKAEGIGATLDESWSLIPNLDAKSRLTAGSAFACSWASFNKSLDLLQTMMQMSMPPPQTAAAALRLQMASPRKLILCIGRARGSNRKHWTKWGQRKRWF